MYSSNKKNSSVSPSKKARHRPPATTSPTVVVPGGGRQCLGVLVNHIHPNDATASACTGHCIHVQPCLAAPSSSSPFINDDGMTMMGAPPSHPPAPCNKYIATQEHDRPIHIPRVEYKDLDNKPIFYLQAEHDYNGIVVTLERKVQNGKELQVLRFVGAGASAYKKSFGLPVYEQYQFHRFAVWGPHVYIAMGKTMACLNFSSHVGAGNQQQQQQQQQQPGQLPGVFTTPGLVNDKNDVESFDDIFRNGQTLAASGWGMRKGRSFYFVDNFTVATDGHPTHQGRFYVPDPELARYDLIQFVQGPAKDGPNQQRLLLVVTTHEVEGYSRIRLLPTSQLRDERLAEAAGEATASITLDSGATKFAVHVNEVLGAQELLICGCHRGLLVVPLSLRDFVNGFQPIIMYLPENENEAVKDVQVVDNVVWILVWNSTQRSNQLIKFGAPSIPLAGNFEMRFL